MNAEESYNALAEHVGCGVCVVGCDKVNALAMKEVRPSEHISDPPPRTHQD